MRFLKDNSYDIVRLFINQIGIAIFSFFLYTAVGMIKDDALEFKLRIILSVFAIGFYFVLLYTVAWEWGAKEKIRIDAGRAERKPFNGAILSILANVPNFLISLLAIIFLGVNMLGGADGFYTAFVVLNLFIRFLESMYLGAIQGIFSLFKLAGNELFMFETLGFLIMPLFAVLATHIGYTMGLKEKRIFGFVKQTSKNK